MERIAADRPIRKKTRGLLESLGDSPAEIAGYLDLLGVRGTPNSSECCAVAELLSAIVATEPHVRSVRVFRRLAVIVRTRPWLCSIVRLPRAVRTFVLAFDAGAYPNLVREGATISQIGDRRFERLEQDAPPDEEKAS